MIVLSHNPHGFASADIGCLGVMNMLEQERETLSRFESVWARVMPGSAPAQAASGEDDAHMLRTMIDQTAAAADVLSALACRMGCHASQLRALACARTQIARQLQGAYYLVTGERHTPGARCAVRQESAACLRCVWLSSRSLADRARHASASSEEPLLQTLYTELAALLDAQQPVLEQLVSAVIG